ncbi:MAG: MATE family efflux transporter [Candidatus Limivivens sp.]|nr:MATE family efflux transporter [Candidatus Limivivens sp.]
MNERDDKFLGTENIWKLMLSLGLPTIVGQVINILYNIVDRIYIGHIPGVGSYALTGVGITLPIITLISAFAAIVGSGGAPLAAIWMGKGDQKHAEKILGNGVFMLCSFSVILMAVFFLFNAPILKMFGASENTFPYANRYITIYLFGTVFVELYLGLNTFIIAQGNSRYAMTAIIAGAVLNTILDPIFIFAFGMGVQGAACATVISQGASAFLVVSFLKGKRSRIRIQLPYCRPDIRIIKNISSLGISPFVMQSTESLITIVLNRSLAYYGGDLYVGSLTILQSIMQFFMAPVSGFTQGVQPIISYNYGAGKFDRVRTVYRRMMAICTSFLTCSAILLIVFPGPFAGLFTTDTELIGLLKQVIPIYMAGMLVFGLQVSIQPVFLALGQAKISLFIATLRKIILLIPLALILPLKFGVMGIYYAEPLADVTAALIATGLFLVNIRKILSSEALNKIR